MRIGKSANNFEIDSYWNQIVVFEIKKILEIFQFSNLDN